MGALSKTLSLNVKTTTMSLAFGKAKKSDKTPTAPVPFTLSLKKQDLFTTLSAFGFTNAMILSPIPVIFLKSSALRNGRPAIIRAAMTGPMPGIILNSFSVAVLMST